MLVYHLIEGQLVEEAPESPRVYLLEAIEGELRGDGPAPCEEAR